MYSFVTGESPTLGAAGLGTVAALSQQGIVWLRGEGEQRESEKYRHLVTSLAAISSHPSTPAALEQKIRRATVCVVGVGGLGTWFVLNLLMASVGKLVLIDDDHVAESNLSRQVMFSQGQAARGTAKVELLIDHLARKVHLIQQPKRWDCPVCSR